MRIEQDLKLDFKDVLIRPKRSTLTSRSEVDISRDYVFLHSKRKYNGIPIIAANMDATGTMQMARALAAQSREKLNPNQELIGQGLANMVGSFFQSYTVSGSFSRSAVAAKSGARTGFYAIVSAVGLQMRFLC